MQTTTALQQAGALQRPCIEKDDRVPKARGFNLIEAAIVLGVVGLIVGGIWVAASQYRNSWVIKELTTQIITTAEGYSKLVPIRSAESMATNQDMSSFALQAGIAPPGWRQRDTAYGWYIFDDFGHTLRLFHLGQFCSWWPWTAGNTCIQAFRFYINDLSKTDCINLVSALGRAQGLSNPAANSQNMIIRMGVNAGAANQIFASFPVLVDAAQQACDRTSGNNITVDFPYRL